MEVKKELINIFEELAFEPIPNRTFSNSRVIKIKMWKASADCIHILQDVISNFYYQLGEHRLRLKGGLDVRVLKDYDICIEYSVHPSNTQEDLETLKILLEN